MSKLRLDLQDKIDALKDQLKILEVEKSHTIHGNCRDALRSIEDEHYKSLHDSGIRTGSPYWDKGKEQWSNVFADLKTNTKLGEIGIWVNLRDECKIEVTLNSLTKSECAQVLDVLKKIHKER